MFELNRQGAVDVIGGGDRISGDQVQELAELLHRHMKHGQPRIVLDLQNIAIIDSAGLELLLDAHDEFKRIGGAIKLANPGSLCREVLKLTGVGTRFEIFDDAGSAVRSYLL